MRFKSTAKGAVLEATPVHSTRLNLVLLAHHLIPLQFFLLRIGSSIIILSLAQAFELLGKGQQENSVCKDVCCQIRQLSSKSKTHRIEWENQVLQVVLWPLHAYHGTSIHTHIHTHTYTIRFSSDFKCNKCLCTLPASSKHTLELTPAELRRTLKSVPLWDSPLSSLTSFSVSWYRSQLETIFLLEKLPCSSFSSPWVSESLSSSTCDQ